MASLKETFGNQAPALRERWKNLVKAHGDQELGKVTVEQTFGGARGVKCLICDTSSVEPDAGLAIRGRPIKDLTGLTPEECFWLLLTGALPSLDELASLRADLSSRAAVPDYVWAVLDAMPKDSHPMAMLNTAILVMEKESAFRRLYDQGLKKDAYGEATLEDALSLLAKLPAICAGVYRLRFGKGPRIAPDPSKDWAGSFVHFLGIPDASGEFAKLMRLWLVLHSDHESGNVSAMTTATVSSALSDLYYAVSAGLNGLAGPLHGLANQECLAWVLETNKKFGGVPTAAQLTEYAEQTLAAGKVVPGYGHAVLRVTDPRFEALLAFGKQHCSTDPVFQTVARVFETVPDVLRKVQKIKDPWPNVDAASGSLLHHYGLVEMNYYTVVFSLSRALGVCAQAVIARAMAFPLVRPKSVTTDWVAKQVGFTG